MHVVRFIQGFDLRNPTRTLDLISPLSATTRISLVQGGFAPGPGKLNVRWSGQNPRRDGQKRTGSTRDNGETTLKYILSGDSQTDVDVLQRKISSFFRDAGLFEEELQAEPVWAMILWGETGGLESLPAPVLGQFARYIRILKGEVGSWPAETWHTVVAGYIEGVEMSLTYEPFYYGLPERAWSAVGDITQTVYGVKVGSDDPTYLRRALTTELSADYTIEGWVTIGTVPTADQTVLHYYVDADNQLLLIWDFSEQQWDLTLTTDGNNEQTVAPATLALNQMVHFYIQYAVDGGATVFKVDNQAWASEDPAGLDPLPADGVLGLGSPANTDTAGGDFIFDGWRIWLTTDFSLALFASIYNAELTAKQQALTDSENNALIGPPTYWLTTAGDDVLANPGSGTLAGVSGDVNALVKWEARPTDIEATPEMTVAWLSRYATIDAAFGVIDTIILGNKSHSFGGAGDSSVSWSFATDTIRGHMQVLAQITIDGLDVDVEPTLPFQHDYDPTTIEDSGPLLYDLGEIFFNWPMFQAVANPAGLGLDLVSAGASDFTLDFALMLPDPMCRVKVVPSADGSTFPFTNANWKVVIDDQVAWGGEDDALPTEHWRKVFEKKGPGITAEPRKYNYIVFLAGAEGEEADTDATWQLVPFVTPRWLLPGGLVA